MIETDAPPSFLRKQAPEEKRLARKESNPKDVLGAQKVPLSVVPMNVILEMGLGMLEGARKYGRHNYRAVGIRSSIYFDAAMRHLIAWWEGEDNDPDSGLPHIVKALTTLAVLRDAQQREMVEDDRPPRSDPDLMLHINAIASEVLKRHEHREIPKHYTRADEGTIAAGIHGWRTE